MLSDTLLLVALLTIPLLAGAALVLFMASGKGKPAAQTDEILEFKARRERELGDQA